MVKVKIYSFKKTLLKGLQYLLFFGVPYAIAGFLTENPHIAGLTVGTILTMFSNWLKNHRK